MNDSVNRLYGNDKPERMVLDYIAGDDPFEFKEWITKHICALEELAELGIEEAIPCIQRVKLLNDNVTAKLPVLVKGG